MILDALMEQILTTKSSTLHKITLKVFFLRVDLATNVK